MGRTRKAWTLELAPLLPAALLCLGLAACRSVPASQVEASMAPGSAAGLAAGDGGQAISCERTPVTPVCCEALSPACNECRAQAAQRLAGWREHCLLPAEAAKDCAGNPPVVACCADGTDACRACREAGLNQLLAWKTACADEDASACERQPPQSSCCQALTPSCDTCQERNRRVLASWERRCEGRGIAKAAAPAGKPVPPESDAAKEEAAPASAPDTATPTAAEPAEPPVPAAGHAAAPEPSAAPGG